MILDALLTALADLTDAGQAFRVNCVDGLRRNEDAVARNARGSLDGAVRLAETAGYHRVTKLLRRQATAETEPPGRK